MKILDEIEHKDLLLEIQEKQILDLKKTLHKHENFLLASGLIVFPFAIFGLYTIIDNLKIRFAVFIVLAIVIFVCVFALLGFLLEFFSEKIKKHVPNYEKLYRIFGALFLLAFFIIVFILPFLDINIFPATSSGTEVSY